MKNGIYGTGFTGLFFLGQVDEWYLEIRLLLLVIGSDDDLYLLQ